MHRISYKVLLAISVLTTLAGLLTLLPRFSASYPNLMGYRSLCTFAPAATFFCFFIAGTACFIRSTFIRDQSGNPGERFRRHSPRLLIPVLVLAAAFFFTWRFHEVKSVYTDAATAASADIQEEGQ